MACDNANAKYVLKQGKVTKINVKDFDTEYNMLGFYKDNCVFEYAGEDLNLEQMKDVKDHLKQVSDTNSTSKQIIIKQSSKPGGIVLINNRNIKVAVKKYDVIPKNVLRVLGENPSGNPGNFTNVNNEKITLTKSVKSYGKIDKPYLNVNIDKDSLKANSGLKICSDTIKDIEDRSDPDKTELSKFKVKSRQLGDTSAHIERRQFSINNINKILKEGSKQILYLKCPLDKEKTTHLTQIKSAEEKLQETSVNVKQKEETVQNVQNKMYLSKHVGHTGNIKIAHPVLPHTSVFDPVEGKVQQNITGYVVKSKSLIIDNVAKNRKEVNNVEDINIKLKIKQVIVNKQQETKDIKTDMAKIKHFKEKTSIENNQMLPRKFAKDFDVRDKLKIEETHSKAMQNVQKDNQERIQAEGIIATLPDHRNKIESNKGKTPHPNPTEYVRNVTFGSNAVKTDSQSINSTETAPSKDFNEYRLKDAIESREQLLKSTICFKKIDDLQNNFLSNESDSKKDGKVNVDSIKYSNNNESKKKNYDSDVEEVEEKQKNRRKPPSKDSDLEDDDSESQDDSRDKILLAKNRRQQQRSKILSKKLLIRQEIEKYMKSTMNRNKKKKMRNHESKTLRINVRNNSCQATVQLTHRSTQTDDDQPSNVLSSMDESFDIDAMLDVSHDCNIMGSDVNFGVGPKMPPYVVNGGAGAVTFAMGNNLDNFNNIAACPGQPLNYNMGYVTVDSVRGNTSGGSGEKENFYKYLRDCINQDSAGNLPLHVEVMNNNLEEVKRYALMLNLRHLSVDSTNNNHLTPLHLAVISNCDEIIVKYLLSRGADLSCMDSDGNNAIHLAVFNNAIGILKVLLQRAREDNFILNTFNYEGFTPLLLATVEDKYDMVKIFLDFGADANVRDQKSGRTPLFHAVENNNLEMVKLLLNNGANKKIKNFSGTSTHDAVFELEGINAEIKNTIIGKDIFAINSTRIDKRKKATQKAKEVCAKKLKTVKTYRKIKLESQE